MKIAAKNFKGIAYVQLGELPSVQQELILQTIHKDLFIKILIEDKIINSCLQYKDYDRWYQNIYKVNADVGNKATAEVAKDAKVLTNI